MRYWYIEKSISVFVNLVLTIADWTISLKTPENAGFIHLPSSSIALFLDSILNIFGRLKRNTLWPGRNLKCSCFPYISLWLHLRSCNMLRLSFKCFSIVLITSLFMRLKLNSLSNAHSMRKCLMQLQLGKCAQKVSWKFQQEVYSNCIQITIKTLKLFTILYILLNCGNNDLSMNESMMLGMTYEGVWHSKCR